VETPETPEIPEESEPRRSGVERYGRVAESHGRGAARWAGRGDEERGFSLIALVLAAAYFVVLFLPWVGFISGWALRVGGDAGVIALALILLELLRLTGSWNSPVAALWAFCLTAAAGILAVSNFATIRWGSGPLGPEGLSYGAWLGLVFGLLILILAVLRWLVAHQRPAL
jgi:hypothetical protein